MWTLDLRRLSLGLIDKNSCKMDILMDDGDADTSFSCRYIAPGVLLGYLYIHTARDLRTPEGELSVMMYEQRADIIAHRHQHQR